MNRSEDVTTVRALSWNESLGVGIIFFSKAHVELWGCNSILKAIYGATLHFLWFMTSTQALDGIITQQSQRLLFIICLFYNGVSSMFWFYAPGEHKKGGGGRKKKKKEERKKK